MRITDITAHVCNAEMRNWIFVKVETDQPGLFGWGEATLEWKTSAVVGAIEDLSPFIVGNDPRDIERNLQLMFKRGFWRAGAVTISAISGIEIALWDIFGKSQDLPVWRLLGGQVRDRLRTYTHLGMGEMDAVYDSFDPEALIERALRVTEVGYSAVKLVNVPYCGYLPDRRALRGMETTMGRLREAVGPDVDIMIDLHGRPASVAAARRILELLTPAEPMFVEEPLPPENLAGMAELRTTTSHCVAAGERIHSRRGFIDAFNARALDIAQPDICHVGGLWEAQKIASLAETEGVGMAPHNPLGPIAGVAALHFGFAMPNVVIQEEMTGSVPWYGEVVEWPITRMSGHWDLPEKPGLGIEVDERAIAAHPFEREILHSSNANLADGTVVDW